LRGKTSISQIIQVDDVAAELISAVIGRDCQINGLVSELEAVEHVHVVEAAGSVIGSRRQRRGIGLEFVPA